MASGMVKKAMVYLGLQDDDYGDFGDYDEPQAPPLTRRPVTPVDNTYGDGIGQVTPIPPRGRRLEPVPSQPEPDSSSSVTVRPNVNTAVPSPTIRPVPPVNARVSVVTPAVFADAQEIGDLFKGAHPVIVNLQSGDRDLSRRMIDFCSGVTYALGGSMDKVADQVFLLTPSNVEVSADEKRRLQEKGLYRP